MAFANPTQVVLVGEGIAALGHANKVLEGAVALAFTIKLCPLVRLEGPPLAIFPGASYLSVPQNSGA